MKLADLDWGEVLGALPRWEALSPAARKALVTIKPGQAVDPLALGTAAAELVAARLITPPGPKGRLYPHAPELRPLLVALRAMDRLRPLEGPRGALPDTYVQDQLTVEEASALMGNGFGRYGWVDRSGVAAAASSIEWLNTFLAIKPGSRVMEWEQARLSYRQKPRMVSPAVQDALRQLLRVLADHPRGVPLRDFHGLLPAAEPKHRLTALQAGLRYLLLFVSLRGESDPEAVIGLLPCIIRRMGPPPPPPAPVPITATFEAPFRVSDMTAVLVDAAAEPISVRGSDGSLYVRAQRALAARFVSPPEWAGELLFDIEPGEDAGELAEEAMMLRISAAVELLQALKLVTVGAKAGKWQLSATPAGRAWLARSEGERLKQILDAYRASPQRTSGWSSSRGSVDFLAGHLPFGLSNDKPDLRAALSEAFLGTPAEGAIPLAPFARHHAELHNPLLGPDAEYLRTRGGSWGTPRTREGWESLWSQMLVMFLRFRLVPLGGARLGLMEGGEIAFALNDVGRYLLGGSDEFRLATEPDGEVMIQPDFEIVFLSPAPRVEAELARVADRTGTGHVGALFRITRASVLRAAESGMTAAKMLKTLGDVSRMPVPANVARQVKDWFGGTRRVRIRPAVLVECPDTETAARVTALGGEQVSAVTRTLLRLDGDPKSVAALAKKLRAKGIFVEE